MEKPRTEPSKKKYFLSGGLALIGVIAFLVFSTLMSTMNQQIIIPGNKDINLKAGKYTAYREIRSVADGKVFDTDRIDLSGLILNVVDKATNTQIIKPNNGLFNPGYTSGSTSLMMSANEAWRSIIEFEIINPGIYEVSGWYEGGKDGARVAILIESEPDENPLVYALGSIGILFVTFGGAVVIFIVTFIKIRKYKSML